ncbi:MAG: DJ-1/PfpI family protein [Planctomycetes bacterium]|nr:DJ-1/PfpI family protein [Planctomycetota bacterium]
MLRRDFLRSTAVCGLAAAAPLAPVWADEPPRTANGAVKPLAPPKEGLIRVAFAISEGTTEIDYVGPQAVFQTWHEVGGKPSPQFKLYTVSHSREPMGGRIADYTFDDVPPPHIVVVPAQRGSDALRSWLRKVSGKTDVTMSVCIGAYHLAVAGLLKGLRATSHHGSIDSLEKEFPDVTWVRGVRFVENEKISTGGGLTAGIDLALHVVERYFGRDRAKKVAEHIEYECTGWMR